MLENIVYSSPLITLILGIIRLAFIKKNPLEDTQIFKNCRLFLIMSFCLTVIFFNKPMIYNLTSADKLTFAFQNLLYIGAFVILYLARKYYKGMHTSGHIFYQTLLLAILSGQILIVSRNLILTVATIGLLMIADFLLLRSYLNKKEMRRSSRVYLGLSLLCFIMLLGAMIWLQEICHDLNYGDIFTFLEVYRQSFAVFIIVALIIIAFVFLLGLAPLHFGLTETLGGVSLPAFAYFVLLRSCAVWAAFMRFNLGILPPLENYFHSFYIGIGTASLFVGAIGACSVKNIRKILAYSNVFHCGIVILMLQNFNTHALFIANIYWLIYMLSMYGISIDLFSIKIKGDYLVTLNEFSGIAHKRPYSAAMFIIFLFSLLGFPPFLGFIGNFSALNTLVIQGNYLQLLIVITMFFFLAYAYLQILQTFCFDKGKSSFDRVDTGIYILMTMVLLSMVVLTIQPHYLLQNLNSIMEITGG